MCYLDNNDILNRLTVADSLFRQINIIEDKYDIIPQNKKHIGVHIEFQDLQELLNEFINELEDTIISWIYSREKFNELKEKAINNGKEDSAAYNQIRRKAREKFRSYNSDKTLLGQGQMGELLLFHFIQHCMKAIPILRKMPITTSPAHERFGADAIHYKIEHGKHIIILGEAKTYTTKYKFKTAFIDAIESILNTYDNHKKEINLYLHEDFLDQKMNLIAEDYLQNKLEDVEIHLVSIVTYNEIKKIDYTNEDDIRDQISKIIHERYSQIDKTKIDISKNPILNRITYIVFPIWKLDELVKEFQSRI